MAVAEAELKVTIEEYLRCEREAEERHEYLNGLVYAMAGESPDHGIISVNLVRELSVRLRGGPCQPFTKDTKVRCEPSPMPPHSMRGLFAYPDIVVACGERQYHDKYKDVLLNPTVIIEILSKTTKDFDRGEKFEHCRTWLPSLQEYVLVHQSQPRIEHYERQKTGQWLLTTIDGMDARLPLQSLDCTLGLQDIYEGIAFSEMPE
jgi:Uma2 family endonuclease